MITFEEYQKKLGVLLERIKNETKANMVLFTPAIFDYAVRARREKARGKKMRQSPLYNQTLMLFGDYLKKVGRENGFPVIDLNTPMMEVLNVLKLENPEAALHADTIVLGPGEDTWPQFLVDFRATRPKRIYRSKNRTLIGLPKTRRDLIKRHLYLVPNSDRLNQAAFRRLGAHRRASRFPRTTSQR